MSLGTVEFDKEFKAIEVMYSDEPGPDLFVRARGIVVSFNESATRVEGEPSGFSGGQSVHFVANPDATDITLASGDKLTVPFSYDEVDVLLTSARKQDGFVDFRKSNWGKLKASS